MNLAVCISGEMRTFDRCYESFYKNILSKNNCDIFISTWNTSNKSIKEKNAIDDIKDITQEILYKFYSPVKLNIFEKPANVSQFFSNISIPKILIEREPIHHRGTIPFSFLINQTNRLLNKYIEKNKIEYDAIIHMRPDLKFDYPIPDFVFEDINYLWTLTSPDDYRVSDRFAISNIKNMNIYSNVWNNLKNYWEYPLGKKKYLFFYNKKNYLIGERLMGYHIKKVNNLRLKQLPKLCDILRY